MRTKRSCCFERVRGDEEGCGGEEDRGGEEGHAQGRVWHAKEHGNGWTQYFMCLAHLALKKKITWLNLRVPEILSHVTGVSLVLIQDS